MCCILIHNNIITKGEIYFMKKWLFAILLGSALVLGACGGDNDDNNNNNGNDNNQQEENGNNNEENGNSEDTAAAESVYKNNCASCHGDDLDGISGPSLEAVGSEYDADEIADIIENGKGGMPPQDVADDDRVEISEWLAGKK